MRTPFSFPIPHFYIKILIIARQIEKNKNDYIIMTSLGDTAKSCGYSCKFRQCLVDPFPHIRVKFAHTPVATVGSTYRIDYVS